MVHNASHFANDFKTHKMELSEYRKIKDLMMLKVGMSDKHCQIIQAMKGLYQNEINSPRRLEQINTIGQLLKVLETRDLLSEENILPLKVLAQQLLDEKDLMRDIIDYEKSHVHMPRINQYVFQPEQFVTTNLSTPGGSPDPAGNHSSFMDVISDRKKALIIEKITEEIGSYWRNLARYLGIREHKIDEIQCENTTVSEKTAKILEMYERKADRQKWFFDLLEALEKAHRRDLSKDLKNIATMN